MKKSSVIYQAIGWILATGAVEVFIIFDTVGPILALFLGIGAGLLGLWSGRAVHRKVNRA